MSRYVRDGLEFDVTEGGPEDGEPVVLLHGFPQRATCWAALTPLLHDAGLRTYAPDQRGYSPGARPDLLRTLTAVSVPHGGAMSRATLSSSQALRSWYFGLFNVPFLVDGVGRLRPHAFDAVLRRTGMGPEQIARFHAEIVDDGALTPALGWYRALPLAMLPPRSADWTHRVDVPATYVWSTGDTAISRAAAERCDAFVLADYRYVELEHVSHWIPEEAPGVLADVILDRVAEDR